MADPKPSGKKYRRGPGAIAGDPPAQQTKVHFLMLGLVLLLFFFLALVYGRPIIQNDGISYYALTISLLEDHDFNLANQHQQHREIRLIQRPDRKLASYYSCGIAFLYLPFVYLTDLFPVLQEWRPYSQNVRFPFSHSLGFFLGSFFYAFASIVLAYFMLVRHQKLSPGVSSLVALCCFVGTPLIFYAFTVPSFTHASDTFLVTAAFVLTISKNPLRFGSLRFRNVLLGFVLAFSVILRNNNIVMVPVLVLGLIYLEQEKGWKNAARICLEIFAGAIPVLIVHVYFNLSQYGKVFTTGYVVDITKHVQRRASRFYGIFLHPVPGIYPWSPIALLGTIGLIVAAKKKSREAIVALVVVAVVIVSINFAAAISPGSTFGQRLLTHLYVFWVLGLSELFVRYKRVSTVLTGICVLWTFLLFNTYFVLTGTSGNMTRPKELTPLGWLRIGATSYREAKQNGEVSNPIQFWYKCASAKPYPVLMQILFKKSER